MEKLLHTPEGVRDIYNVECGKKLALENRLKKTLHLFGYHDIQTPTFEYFDVFRKEIGTIPSKDLYKFFDKEGNTLVLRPDITPSIARVAATLFGEEDLPIRLCYTGNTFINHSNNQGRLREVTQMGAELIGDDSVEADAEMLAMVIESMQAIGLKEFQLSVGHLGFFQSLIEDAALDEEARERVVELINNRNYFGVEEYLSLSEESFGRVWYGSEKVGDTGSYADPEKGLGGGMFWQWQPIRNPKPNKFGDGKMACINFPTVVAALILALYGVEKFVTFDLSMTGNYGYYTGIIFRGYTFGTGDAVVKGGRYDHLLEKFGKTSASIGFAIVIDELMNALIRQKIRIVYTRKNAIILYDESRARDAIRLAKDFRAKAKNTELIKKSPEKGLEDYIRFGKEYYAGSLVYIKKSGEITMVNLVTGEQKEVNNNK